jgi:hypothetical protein
MESVAKSLGNHEGLQGFASNVSSEEDYREVRPNLLQDGGETIHDSISSFGIGLSAT